MELLCEMAGALQNTIFNLVGLAWVIPYVMSSEGKK